MEGRIVRARDGTIPVARREQAFGGRQFGAGSCYAVANAFFGFCVHSTLPSLSIACRKGSPSRRIAASLASRQVFTDRRVSRARSTSSAIPWIYLARGGANREADGCW